MTRRRSTLIFIIYRVVLGVVLLGLLHQGVLRPLSGVENVDTPKKPLQLPLEKQLTE